MVEISPTKSAFCTPTLDNSNAQKVCLNEENDGFYTLYEEAQKLDLGPIDEDWFNGSFEQQCNSKCLNVILEHEIPVSKHLVSSQLCLSDTCDCFSSSKVSYSAKEISTRNYSNGLQDSFNEQKNENLSPNNRKSFTTAESSALEFHCLLQENYPTETEHNLDQALTSERNEHVDFKTLSENCNDLSVVSVHSQDFTCDAMEQHNSLQQSKRDIFISCRSPLAALSPRTCVFKNTTPVIENVCRIKQKSHLSSQLLKWSPITVADLDQSSPRIFPIFESPLTSMIKCSTPYNLTQSLGAQMCGKDLEWNSTMETPFAANLALKCTEDELLRNMTYSSAQAKIIPRTLFIDDKFLAEEDKAVGVHMIPDTLKFSSQQELDDMPTQLLKSTKEDAIESSSLHSMLDDDNNNSMPAANLFSEPKFIDISIDQNIANTLKYLVSSQKASYYVETSPDRLNIETSSYTNEAKIQDMVKELSNLSSLSDEFHIYSDCLEQAQISGTSIQNALSFLFTGESKITLRCTGKENEENSLSNQQIEPRESEGSKSNQLCHTKSRIEIAEDNSSMKSKHEHSDSVISPLNSSENTLNKQYKFSGFHSASGKSTNISQQSLKPIKIMWEKVKEDPWSCDKQNGTCLCKNCDDIENELAKTRCITSIAEQKKGNSNVINKIFPINNNCHESNLETQLLHAISNSDTSFNEQTDTITYAENKSMTEHVQIALEVKPFEKSSLTASQICKHKFNKAKMPLDDDMLNKWYGNESQLFCVADFPLTQMLEVAESTHICLKEMEESPSQLQLSLGCTNKIDSSINMNCNTLVQSPKSSPHKNLRNISRHPVSFPALPGISPRSTECKNELLTSLGDNHSKQSTCVISQAVCCLSHKCHTNRENKSMNNCTSKKCEVSLEKLGTCLGKFESFMTASGKVVKISNLALEKSKQIFADLDSKIAKEMLINMENKSNNFIDCFHNVRKTAPKEIANNEICYDSKVSINNNKSNDQKFEVINKVKNYADNYCFHNIRETSSTMVANNETCHDSQSNTSIIKSNDQKFEASNKGKYKVKDCEKDNNQLACDLNEDIAISNESSKKLFKRTENLKNIMGELTENNLFVFEHNEHNETVNIKKFEATDINYILFSTKDMDQVPNFYTAAGEKISVSEHSLNKAKYLLTNQNLRLPCRPNEDNLELNDSGMLEVDQNKYSVNDNKNEYIPTFDMGNFMACSQDKDELSHPCDEKFFISYSESQKYKDVFMDRANIVAVFPLQECNDKGNNTIDKEADELENADLTKDDGERQSESGITPLETICNSEAANQSAVFLKNKAFQTNNLLKENICINNCINIDACTAAQYATSTIKNCDIELTNNNKTTSHINTKPEINQELKFHDNLIGNYNLVHLNAENTIKSTDDQIKQTKPQLKTLDNQMTNKSRSYTGTSDKNILYKQEMPFSEFSAISSEETVIINQNNQMDGNVNVNFTEFHNFNKSCNSVIQRPSNDKFAGFSTASGRKVEVLAESLSKAKAILNNADKMHNTECTIRYSEQSAENINSKLYTIAKGNIDRPLGNSSFIGFTTASGKKIDVLSESLSKAKMILEDANESCVEDTNGQTESQRKSLDVLVMNVPNRKINVKNTLVTDYLKQQKEHQILHPVPSEMICADAMNFKAKDLNNSFQQDRSTSVREQFPIQRNDKGKSIKLIPKNKLEAIPEIMSYNNCSSANIHKLGDIGLPLENYTLEDISLNQSKAFNKDVYDKCKTFSGNMTNISEMSFPCFTKPSGNKTFASKRTLEISKEVLHGNESKKKCFDFNIKCLGNKITYVECEEKFQKYPLKEEGVPCIGFYTAAGKQIPISHDSLQVAEILLQSKDENVKEECKLLDSNNKKNTLEENQLVGFTTASGKELQISEHSLRYVKQMLQYCEEDSVACTYISNNGNINSPNIAIYSEAPAKGSTCDTLCSGASDELPVNLHDVKNMDENYGTNISLQKNFKEVTNNTFSSDFIAPFKNDRQHYGNTISSKRTNKEITAMESHQKRHRTEFSDLENSKMLDIPSIVTISEINTKVLNCDISVEEERQNSRKLQEERINQKKRTKISVIPGTLWHKKVGNNVRKRLREVVGDLYPGSVKSKFSAEEIQTILCARFERSKHFVFKAYNCFDAEVCNNSIEIKIADDMIIIINDKNEIGFDDLCRAFLDGPGVDPNFINQTWIENHYSWIIWKLAAMEVSFPSLFQKQCLTPENVLLQIKYRYDKEIDNAQRSALKKIMEQDDSPAKTMVLCIASIKSIGCDKETSIDMNTECKNYCLLLTDGWYGIPASIDNAMKCLIMKGKIEMGQKIIVSGAELIGSDVACNPLEAPSELMLKISTNSVRRARWDVKLGYFQSPKPFPVSFSSIYPDGGSVGCVDCIVLRVYPLLFMEKCPNGNIAFHNERIESKAVDSHLKLRELQLEKLAESVQKEFEALLQEKENKIEKKKKSYNISNVNIQDLNTGKEIYEAVDILSDFGAVETDLNTQQKYLLSDYKNKLQSEQREKLEEMMKNSISEAIEENKLIPDRISIPLLKVLLVGTSEADRKKNGTCLLTVWRPSEKCLQYMTEGHPVRIYHLSPGTSKKRRNQICLNSTKRTDFEENPVADQIAISCFIPRKVSQFTEINGDSMFDEIDTVGIVISIVSPFNEHCGQLQIVYLSDHNMKFLAIKFPKGISFLGMEDILQQGNLVAGNNLSIEHHNHCYIPVVIASELSTFTCCPKSSLHQSALHDIQTSIKDVPSFLVESQDMLRRIQCQQWHSPLAARNLLSNSVLPVVVLEREMTPVQNKKKMPSSSKRKLYPVYSPLCLQEKSPLGTAIQQTSYTSKYISPPNTFKKIEPISPAEIRSQEVKERIFRLSKYGSAPPLTTLTSPASASSMKQFSKPHMKQDTTPLTTKRKGIRQWRGKALSVSNETNLQENWKV